MINQFSRAMLVISAIAFYLVGCGETHFSSNNSADKVAQSVTNDDGSLAQRPFIRTQCSVQKMVNQGICSGLDGHQIYAADITTCVDICNANNADCCHYTYSGSDKRCVFFNLPAQASLPTNAYSGSGTTWAQMCGYYN